MLNVHVISGDVVVNTIVAADLATAQTLFPGATVIVATTGGIGWLWNGTALTAPASASPVPASVTPYQARAAMHATPSKTNAGKTLLDDATALVAASPDPLVPLAWEYASSFVRGDRLVNSLSAALGLSGADLDALFIAASQAAV